MLPGNRLMWRVERKSLLRLDEYTDPPDQDPNRDLVAAVIERAIMDLAYGGDDRGNERDPRTQQDAFWWLFVDEGERIMSLAWCCEVLDITKREVRLRASTLYPKVCWRLAGVWAGQVVNG